MAQRCASCGTEGTGKFCSACGAPLAPRTCPSCGATAAPGGRFCTACGTPLDARGGRPAGSGARLAALGVAAILALGLAAALLLRGPRAAGAGASPAGAPAAAPLAGGGQPPDLSAMTPREAFDRLYNRVMAAAEQGDTGAVAQFAPMALLAYGNLPVRDADARYHAAMLRLHTGDPSGAAALADTILAEQPDHLFGYAVRVTVGQLQGDPRAVQEGYAALLAAWDAENARKRPEYADHRAMLDRLAAEARASAGR